MAWISIQLHVCGGEAAIGECMGPGKRLWGYVAIRVRTGPTAGNLLAAFRTVAVFEVIFLDAVPGAANQKFAA